MKETDRGRASNLESEVVDGFWIGAHVL